MSTQGSAVGTARAKVDGVRNWLERLLLWRIWERMLEIEFVDRSIALAGKAFVSFFPLVIVISAFVPERLHESIVTAVTTRFGLEGPTLRMARGAFASSNDVKQATGVLGLVLAIFFASSFTTALQRVYLRAWRRPPHSGRAGTYWRGATWLTVMVGSIALLGAVRGASGDGVGLGLFVAASLAVSSGLWWFTAWFLLRGEVRPRVLIPTGIITGIAITAFAASAPIWMPDVVTKNHTQFGFFGVALSLVTWFSGAAICVLVGACAGPVFAEDPGGVGSLVRGGDRPILRDGAPPSLAPPARALTLRDAFTSTEET
jgi:membrane protein